MINLTKWKMCHRKLGQRAAKPNISYYGMRMKKCLTLIIIGLFSMVEVLLGSAQVACVAGVHFQAHEGNVTASKCKNVSGK